MVFDLRTCDAAYAFLLEFLGMTGQQFIMDYVCDCDSDEDRFWTKHFDAIDAVDINDLRFMAFHVTASLDDCQEIKSTGLMNLQNVLAGDTMLARILRQHELTFDIKARTMSYKGKLVDIDYNRYRGRWDLSKQEKLISRVSHRLYYDYCVNGFFYNDDIPSYATKIHEKPEFIYKLVELFPDLKAMESNWIQESKSYRVDFFATFDQIDDSTFSLEEKAYSPHDFYQELSDEQKLKKWMLMIAISRGFHNSCGESFVYIKDETIISPEQIVDCKQLTFANK